MKKIIFTTLILASSLAASAQVIDHKSNLQINAGGGIHSLQYTPLDGEHAMGYGYLFEAQYQYMFTKHFGLALGVQYDVLNASAIYNYDYIENDLMLPGAIYPADVTTRFFNWKEKQHIAEVSVPLQLLFRAPMGPLCTFQLGAGVSFNKPLAGTYSIDGGRYSRTAYMSNTNVTYEDLPTHGLGIYETRESHDLQIPDFYLGLLADLGFDFNLSDHTGLYVGLYGSYSTANINVANTNYPLNSLAYAAYANNTDVNASTFASDRVDAVHPLQVGLKLGLRFGMGHEIGWRRNVTADSEADALAQAQAEAEQAVAQKAAEEQEKAREEALRQAKEQAEARAKAEADSIAAVHAAELAKAKAEAEARAKAQADSIAKAKAEEARIEAERKAKQEHIKSEQEREEQRIREEAAFLAGFKDTAYFETAKDTPIFGQLDKDSWVNLKNVMANNPSIRVTITGHTDNVGSIGSNVDLSQRRANNVKKMLVKYGIPANKIDAYGRADFDPIADNDTEEGRAKNRRVEITIGL